MRKSGAGGRSSSPKRLLLAERGAGPLLQRDYWCVIRACRLAPPEILSVVRRHFPAFAPAELAAFSRRGGKEGALALGEELEVKIAGAGRFLVRVIHVDEQSLTLASESDHPEAGRITFGSYRNRQGEVIFHIRSRARSRDRRIRTGFLAGGEVMQTSTWTDFVNRVAAAFGEGVRGLIHAETSPCEDESENDARRSPTYAARGG